jgi:hypothetical protein
VKEFFASRGTLRLLSRLQELHDLVLSQSIPVHANLFKVPKGHGKVHEIILPRHKNPLETD